MLDRHTMVKHSVFLQRIRYSTDHGSKWTRWLFDFTRNLAITMMVLFTDICSETLATLQRVMYAAARIVYNLKPYDHFMPHSKPCIGFQWSRELSLLVHILINKRAPVYLQNLFHSYCIHVRSGLKPLCQQQRPCQAINQTQTWWTRLLRWRTRRLESAAHRPQSHHGY